MKPFGAFVELEDGLEALVHISNITTKRISKPQDVLELGQEVTAKVVDFNEDEKKISLSVKALLAPDPEPVEEVQPEDDADVVSVDIDAVIANQTEEDAE